MINLHMLPTYFFSAAHPAYIAGVVVGVILLLALGVAYDYVERWLRLRRWNKS